MSSDQHHHIHHYSGPLDGDVERIRNVRRSLANIMNRHKQNIAQQQKPSVSSGTSSNNSNGSIGEKLAEPVVNYFPNIISDNNNNSDIEEAGPAPKFFPSVPNNATQRSQVIPHVNSKLKKMLGEPLPLYNHDAYQLKQKQTLVPINIKKKPELTTIERLRRNRENHRVLPWNNSIFKNELSEDINTNNSNSGFSPNITNNIKNHHAYSNNDKFWYKNFNNALSGASTKETLTDELRNRITRKPISLRYSLTTPNGNNDNDFTKLMNDTKDEILSQSNEINDKLDEYQDPIHHHSGALSQRSSWGWAHQLKQLKQRLKGSLEQFLSLIIQLIHFIFSFLRNWHTLMLCGLAAWLCYVAVVLLQDDDTDTGYIDYYFYY